MQSMGRFGSPRAYLDDQFTYRRDDHQMTVLASAVVDLTTYYAACERVDVGGDRTVFAVICLVRYNPRAADGYIFAYKDMDEAMGPHESACPERILDLLTPTDREYAVAWRARCRDAIARRKAIAARPTPRPGQTIIFELPLTLSNGAESDRFEVVADTRNPRRALFREPVSRALVRIPGVKKRSYRLVSPAVRISEARDD